MKYVFLVTGIILSLMAYFTPMIIGRTAVDGQKIYWVTDPNPARNLQIDVFKEWLKENKNKKVDMSVDTANSSAQKVIIQGVTGVAGDVIDYWGISKLQLLDGIGMMEDVTSIAKKRGFSLDDTYPNLRSLLTVDGKQKGYPANVISYSLFVNEDAFEKTGIELLSKNPTLEEFEKKGIEFVKIANRGEDYQKYFFSSELLWFEFARTFGADLYNETLTGPGVNNPGWIETLNKIDYHINEIRIIPTKADMDSFSTGAGYGGSAIQLFHSGKFATMRNGRYAMIQLREMSPFNFTVVQLPYSDFQTCMLGTRAVFAYTGSDNLDLSLDFMEYLSSEEYNMLIVKDADGNPPNPKYLDREEYKRPTKYTNEWGAHDAFIDSTYFGIPDTLSPYHEPAAKSKIWYKTYDRWYSGLITTEDFPTEVKKAFDYHKDLYFEKAKDEVKKDYEHWTKVQEKVEKALANGDKLKREWIRNEFYLNYYEYKGMLE